MFYQRLGSLLNCSIVILQFLSTVSNFSFSFCIFALISSEEKMGSKYIHPRWVFIHPSRVSWMRMILDSVAIAFANIGLMAGLALHIKRIFSWSSSDCWASSIPFSTYVPVFLYFIVSTFKFFNTYVIELSFFSRLHCRSTFLLISSMISLWSASPTFKITLKVNSEFG